MFKRSSGILIHISSLPGEYGIGDFGKKAYEFVDFLASADQKLWQILPMGQTGYGDSPYQCFSAFAGNPYFIDLEDLVERGYLKKGDLKELKEGNNEKAVDYALLHDIKIPLLRKAYEEFLKEDNREIFEFKERNKYWIEDYCLYMALKERFGGVSWHRWPKEYRYRKREAMTEARASLDDEMGYYLFVQYIFHEQWKKLKEYTNDKGIKIVGDIPIFIAGDSADAWSRSKLFDFNRYKKPRKVAGCPPDAFSRNGQLWGNPLYNWDYMKRTGYEWWIERIKACFELHDIVRIDHFRGFESYWAIPAGAKTAAKGRWQKGPGMDLFNAVKRRLGDLPIIAEDLGFLTPRVKKLLKDSGYPGMKILEFAFDSREENDYLPHRYEKNSVAYTGTHDNDTVVGWYQSIGAKDKKMCDTYLKKTKSVKSEEINFKFIEAIWGSKSVMALTQAQDLFGIGSEGRMNIPSVPTGNWQWRMEEKLLSDKLAQRLSVLTKKYER